MYIYILDGSYRELNYSSSTVISPKSAKKRIANFFSLLTLCRPCAASVIFFNFFFLLQIIKHSLALRVIGIPIGHSANKIFACSPVSVCVGMLVSVKMFLNTFIFCFPSFSIFNLITVPFARTRVTRKGYYVL